LEVLEQTLWHLADELSRQMRKKELKGRTITVKIRLEDFSTFTRSRTLPDLVDSSEVIHSVALEHFRKFDRAGKKVRLLGIGVAQLNTIVGEQLGLFVQPSREKRDVDKIMDAVRDKFGEKAIQRATLTKRKAEDNTDV